MNNEIIKVITFGEYSAEISTSGAALAALRFRNLDLIEPRTHSRYFSGEILAPWPNRIANGQYSYNGKTYQLPINEVNRNNALHGLVFDKSWEITSAETDRICLEIVIDDPSAYPGKLQLQVEYRLSEDGLMTSLYAKNLSDETIPYGASTHPYISVPGLKSVNDFILKVGSSEVLLTDSDRLLPTILVDVEKFEFDFRRPRTIGEQFIDHAFKQDPLLAREVLVTSPSGEGVAITFGESARWIQIHTADRTGGFDSRKVLAVEPMTCPPDSFNSGIDLIELVPGQSHEFSWNIKFSSASN